MARQTGKKTTTRTSTTTKCIPLETCSTIFAVDGRPLIDLASVGWRKWTACSCVCVRADLAVLWHQRQRRSIFASLFIQSAGSGNGRFTLWLCFKKKKKRWRIKRKKSSLNICLMTAGGSQRVTLELNAGVFVPLALCLYALVHHRKLMLLTKTTAVCSGNGLNHIFFFFPENDLVIWRIEQPWP